MVERVLKLIETKTYGNEKDFALQIGIKQQTINNYTKGKRTVSLDAVIAILTAYEDVSAEWLLRGKGEMLISDNLPKFHGEESDSELDVHAELSRKTAELEELKLQVLRLDAQKDYLQERNDDLVISCRMLQDELNKYQEPKKKKSIV
jgi:transcriptional regulator with XRE-family HTH domain